MQDREKLDGGEKEKEKDGSIVSGDGKISEISLHAQEKRLVVKVWLPITHGLPSSALFHIKSNVSMATALKASAYQERASHPLNPSPEKDEKIAKQSEIASEMLDKTGEIPQEGDRIGHGAVLFPNGDYASWWPDPKAHERTGLFNVVSATDGTYEGDIKSEGGEANFIVCFYTLDNEECRKKLKDIKETDYGWALLGDKPLIHGTSSQRGQSCFGLVYEILQAGGADRLSSYLSDLTLKNIIVTPENFLTFIKRAKENELRRYPETQEYDNNIKAMPGEYRPTINVAPGFCLTM